MIVKNNCLSYKLQIWPERRQETPHVCQKLNQQSKYDQTLVNTKQQLIGTLTDNPLQA